MSQLAFADRRTPVGLNLLDVLAIGSLSSKCPDQALMGKSIAGAVDLGDGCCELIVVEVCELEGAASEFKVSRVAPRR